jgi:hypothetical protein
MSTVKKKDRKQTSLEFVENFRKIKKAITLLIFDNFGCNIKEVHRGISKRCFNGVSYHDLSDKQKAKYNDIYNSSMQIYRWFIIQQRACIKQTLDDITENIRMANSIYPTTDEELAERRGFQNEAIGKCFVLLDNIQNVAEVLPVNMNRYTPIGLAIEDEISLLILWKRANHKIKTALSTNSSTNFANVNSNGNANNNNASNVNGVRPDCTSVVTK